MSSIGVSGAAHDHATDQTDGSTAWRSTPRVQIWEAVIRVRSESWPFPVAERPAHVVTVTGRVRTHVVRLLPRTAAEAVFRVGTDAAHRL